MVGFARWVIGMGGVGLAVACNAAPAPRVARSPAPPLRWLPTTDLDRDRITDAYDACPMLPGLPSPVLVLNGCPPPGYYDDGLAPNDRDGDGVLDAADACPDDPGAPAATPEVHGCPVPASPMVATPAPVVPDLPEVCRTGPPDAARAAGCPPAWVDGDRIRIVDEIRFASGSANLLTESDAVLTAVSEVLARREEIRHVRVEGHTDDRGGPDLNRALSRRRAEAVVHWLAEHGVASARLEGSGKGFERPIAPNDTPEGRARNRRVEFWIVADPTAPNDVAAPSAPPVATRAGDPSLPPAPVAPPPGPAAPASESDSILTGRSAPGIRSEVDPLVGRH